MYFLGIDAGGTKTTCAVGDEQQTLARVEAPSCKIQRVGEANARTALQQGTTEACAKAGITPQQLAAVCIGASGISQKDIADKLRTILASVTPAAVEAVGDNVIAMEAAFGASAGVIVNAGTGSFAQGRDEQGQTARAGGWGATLSDEGSGTRIGRQAAAAVLRAYDEQQATMLTELLLGAWNVTKVEELAGIANGQPGPDFAALFPMVAQCAVAGDAVASAVLRRAGRELGELARIVIERLWPQARREKRVRVRLTGSVFRRSALVRSVFFHHLLSERTDAATNFVIVDPVEGALEIARKKVKGKR